MGEGDQYFAVSHAGRGAVAERHRVGAIRQPYIVEHQLDFVGRYDFPDRVSTWPKYRSVCSIRVPAGPDVQAELPRVDRRERSRARPRAAR